MLRFVPTSNKLLLDDLKVALINYIASKKNNEKFIICIDEDSVELVELLNLFSIKADEVTYQSYNLKFHQQLATKLLMDKNAFNCFCEQRDKPDEPYKQKCKNLPDSEVIDNESPFSVRIKKPESSVMIKDKLDGKLEFSPENVDDFIILNVDKSPTYNFACAIDDMLSDISLVIKSIKDIEDTPKQVHIRKKLGYEKDVWYIHLPTFNNEVDVKSLLEKGFLPEAIINYILLSTFETQKEFFTLDEAIEWFDISKILKTSISFNIKKLESLNKEHIKAMDSVKVATLVGFKSKDIGELAKVYANEENTINNIKEKIDKIFLKKECDSNSCEKLKSIMIEAPFFEDFSEFEKYCLQRCELDGEEFEKTMSYLLTSSNKKEKLSDIYPHIKNYIKEIVR
jgi:glutamyl-tRNA synthetase